MRISATALRHGRACTLAGCGFWLAVLLGLGGCGAEPAPTGRSGYAQAPGVYFHNDVSVVSGIGAGSSRR
jgi:hypothetical protein